MTWFDEKIENVNSYNFIYKIICFFLGGFKHRLSYKEWYLLQYGLYRKKLGNVKAKEKAMMNIIEIYKHLHDNNLPKEMQNDD
jgi:hypothetical protein